MSGESPSAIAKQASDFLLDLARGKYDVELKEAEEKLTAIGVPWAIMAREALHAFVTINKAIAPDAVQPDGAGGRVPTTSVRINPKTVPKPIAFKAVYTAMKQYKERAAPGGQCDAFADFAEHSRKRLGQLPWNLPGSLSVSRQFANYWLAVAAGASPDYDATTGAWIDTADA